MSVLGYRVYSSHIDPEAPNQLEFIGGEKTLRGAQGLAEKVGKGKIYGWYANGTDKYSANIRERMFVVEKGWYEP